MMPTVHTVYYLFVDFYIISKGYENAVYIALGKSHVYIAIQTYDSADVCLSYSMREIVTRTTSVIRLSVKIDFRF
jgi:hypothetical protein